MKALIIIWCTVVILMFYLVFSGCSHVDSCNVCFDKLPPKEHYEDDGGKSFCDICYHTKYIYCEKCYTEFTVYKFATHNCKGLYNGN